MQAIYKIIDKDLNKKIDTERQKEERYLKEKLEFAKNLLPDIDNLAILRSSIDSTVSIVGFSLNPGSDKNIFKETKNKDIYVIKKNTKKGKDLNKKLDFLNQKIDIFKPSLFEEDLNYKPKERQVFDGNTVTLNILQFGYVHVDNEVVFLFRGYDGYEPNDKVQEITISEYNSYFGR